MHSAAAPNRPLAPRPSCDLEVDELVERSGELARRWAAALVLALPSERLGQLPLAELALDGPRLCAQLLRALVSDADLDRLVGRDGGGRERSAPARRIAAITGASDAAACVNAVEILRGVLREALEEAPGSIRDAPGAGDRLAHVCAAAAAAAVGVHSQAPPDEPGPDPDPARSLGVAARQRSGQAPALVDEPGAGDPPRSRRDLPGLPPEAQTAPIQIRDVRGDGAAPWIWAITRQLDRLAADGEPFSVLLVELLDADRVAGEEPDGELDRLGEGIERVLLDALRRPSGSEVGRGSARGQGQAAPDAGWMTAEGPGRWWLVAAARDRHAAQELADRVVHAGAALRTGGGRALALGVGTASCPEDGREAAALAAHAEVGLHAARAAFRAAAGTSAAGA